MDLSVVVPMYNAAPFIEKCLHSILDQKLPTDVRWEVVVVDDGATDRSADLVQNIQGSSSRLHLVRHDLNRGGAAARNTGICHSRGDLVRIVDADNMVPQGLLARELCMIRDLSCSAVSVSSLVFIDPYDQTTGSSWTLDMNGPFSKARAFETFRSPPAHGNYMFRRDMYESIGGYDESFGAMDTWTFGTKHVLLGHTVEFVPGSYYLHRHGMADSYWTRSERNNLNNDAILRFVNEYRSLVSDRVASRMDVVKRNHPQLVADLIESGFFLDRTSDSEARLILSRVRSRRLRARLLNPLHNQITRLIER